MYNVIHCTFCTLYKCITNYNVKCTVYSVPCTMHSGYAFNFSYYNSSRKKQIYEHMYVQMLIIIFSFYNLAVAYLGSCIHFYLIHILLCNHIHTFHRVIHSTVDHMGSHDRNDLQILKKWKLSLILLNDCYFCVLQSNVKVEVFVTTKDSQK